jgi:Domain of unknown function (DUF4129)
VTQPVPPVSGAVLPADFVAAHKALVADKDIQFSLGAVPEFKPPAWLKALKPIADFLEFFAPFAKFLFWGFLALIVAAILYYIFREFGDLRWPWRKKAEEAEEEWLPDAAPARALLAEADALAAEGRFGEAAHLLLLRSVEDIEARKPKLLTPSSTAREIADTLGLPEKARGTFALIARHVEASLFGGRDLDAGGWDQCREAYGRFALAGEWR